MVKVLRLIALLIWVATSGKALAQTGTPEFYQLEVLVFQTNLAHFEGEELWTSDVVNTKLPGIDKAVELPNAPPALDSPLWKAAGTLEADREYRLLAHKRWLLRAEPQSSAKWIYLRGKTAEGWELEGTLRFYQARFLHVNVELVMREPPVSWSASTSTESPGPKAYRISEHRRIRSGELNYFDHPKFGALLQVGAVDRKKP